MSIKEYNMMFHVFNSKGIEIACFKSMSMLAQYISVVS